MSALAGEMAQELPPADALHGDSAGPRAASADMLVLRLAPLPAEALEGLVSPAFRAALAAAGAGDGRAGQEVAGALPAELERILAALRAMTLDAHARWVLDEVRDRLDRLAGTLGKPSEKPGRRFRAAMRALRYLSRVSHKTSPFQRYMAVGICEGDGAASAGGPVRFQLESRERLAQEWIAVLRHGHADALGQGGLFELAGELSADADRLDAELHTLMLTRGTLWRTGRRKSFTLRAPVGRIFRALSGRTFALEELTAACGEAGLSPAETAGLVRGLVDRGLVRRAPAGAEAAEAALAGAPDPALVGRLAADPLLQDAPRLYRDCWMRLDDRPDYDVAAIRDRVCDVLRDLSMPSPEHRLLRDLFQSLAPGEGASLPLPRLAAEIESAAPQLLARLSDLSLAQRLAAEGLGPGCGHHPFCAHVQPFRENGALRLVLNGTFDEPVWLLSRYTQGEDGKALAMRRRLRAWLARQTELTSERFVGLSRGGEVSSLQRHGGLAERYLAGFAPPGDPTPVLPLADCHVSLAPGGRRLQVTDGEGLPVRFVNFGSVLPSPAWGLHYWMIHLTAPVAVMRPGLDKGFVGDETAPRRHRPREYRGDCVLFRETWYETSQDLLDAVWKGEGEAHLPTAMAMTALARYFHERGMPAQVFVARKPGMDWHASNSMANRHRKPQWIDIANPVCVALLRRILRESRTVVFQEVLPGPQDRLARAGGGSHAVELHLEASLTW